MMSNFNISNVKALAWDVGGTVFDWHHTIKQEITALATSQSKDIEATTFTNKWRFKMFELLQPIRKHEAPWRNADQLHLEALEIVLNEYDWAMTIGERDQLNTVWHRLNAWPDAPANIEKLRSRFQVTVLTVLSWQIAVSCSKHNGISWDGILSCEFLGHYKPDPEAYQKAATLLGLRPDEVMMCAAHENDLNGAADAGLRTGYVHVPEEKEVVIRHFQVTGEAIGLGGTTSSLDANAMVEIPPDSQYDVVAKDFNELSAKLLA